MLEVDNNMLEIDNPRPDDIPRDSKGRWLPGRSAHPGQPKGNLSLVGILRKRLTKHPEDARAIVDSLIKMGKTRELGAIKELLDRIDGKVVERHRLEGELPIKLVFVPAKELLGATETSQDAQEGALTGQTVPQLSQGD